MRVVGSRNGLVFVGVVFDVKCKVHCKREGL